MLHPQQLVEEKRRALEATAPPVSLEEYLDGGKTALEQHAEELLAAAPLPPTARVEVAEIPDVGSNAREEAASEWLYPEPPAAAPAGPPPAPQPTPQPTPPLQPTVPPQPPPPPPTATAGARQSSAHASKHVSPEANAPSPGSWNASAAGSSVSNGAPNLHRSSEAAQMRAMRLQQELLVREMAECTFHPRTNVKAQAKVTHARPRLGHVSHW